MKNHSFEILEKQALTAAKNGLWAEAIKHNLNLLKLEPENTVVLNRLAWAYLENDQKKKAVCTYKKVLEIDKYNAIATKNLDKLTQTKLDSAKPKKNGSGSVSFLEIKGKTKIATLIKLTTDEILSSLHYAEEVNLIPKRKRITVKDCADRYLGALPDDVSFRLYRCITKGNKYQAWVKTVEPNKIQIFIKEISCCPELADYKSFPTRR